MRSMGLVFSVLPGCVEAHPRTNNKKNTVNIFFIKYLTVL